MIVALGLLLLIPLGFSHDSEGTLFYWNYIRNADTRPTVPYQNLSVTILNGANAGSCDFTMFYREDFGTNLTSKTVTVAQNSASSLTVPSYYGFAFDTNESPQTSHVPSVTLTANSSCPVTLIANNYDSATGQGDSFMVLPVNWASTYFTFTLPPAIKGDRLQYQVVTFISPQGTANVLLNVVEHDGGSPLSFQVNTLGGMTDYISLTTPDGKPRTYRVTSDLPIQIVAGVTCVGVYGGNTCDHVAFMPQPVPSIDCRSYEWVDDDHVSDTVSTGSFYIDIPNTCTTSQNVTATSAGNASGRQVRLVTLNPSKTSVLQNYSTAAFGRAVSFHAGGSATHVTRVSDSSSSGGSGAFATSVASLTSYILAPSYFYTRNANDSVEIICTSLVCSAIYIDDLTNTGTKLNPSEGDSISVDGQSYFSFTFVIANAGIHFITFRNPPSSGGYTYYVSGKSNGYAYGYLGHVNLPRLVVLPTTPAPSPTTTLTPLPNNVTGSSTTPTTVTTLSAVSTASKTSSISTASPTSSGTPSLFSTEAPPSTPTSSSVQTTVTPSTAGMTTSTPPTTSTSMFSSTTIVTQTSPTYTTISTSTTSSVTSSTPGTSPFSTSPVVTTASSSTNMPSTTTSASPVVTTASSISSTFVSTSTPSTVAITSTAPIVVSTSTSTSPTVPSVSTSPSTTPTTSPTMSTISTTVTTLTSTPVVSTSPITSSTSPLTSSSSVTTSPTTTSTQPGVTSTSSSTTSPTTATSPTTPPTSPTTPTSATVLPPVTTTTRPVVTTPVPPGATTTVAPPPVTTASVTTPSTKPTSRTTQPTTQPTTPSTTPKAAWTPMLFTALCLIVSACIL